MTRALVLAVAIGLFSGPEEDVRAELARLIDVTNQYESFYVRYRMLTMEGRDEEPSETVLEFAYEAPDLGYFSMTQEEGSLRTFVTGRKYLIYSDTGEAKRWLATEYPAAAPFREPYLELFGEPNFELEAGALFNCGIKQTDGGDEGPFRLSIGLLPYGRHAVLDWLPRLRDGNWSLELEEAVIVAQIEAGQLRISRENGMIQSALLEEEGRRLEVTLLEVEIDGSVEHIFDLPEEADDAASHDQLQREFALQEHPWRYRADAYRTARRRLEQGKWEWDLETRGACADFLEALHRPVLPTMSQLQGILVQVEEIADKARTALEEEGVDRGALIRELRQSRGGLEKSLGTRRDVYFERLPRVEGGDSDALKSLLEMEEQIIERLFDETVRTPALEAFDEVLFLVQES